MELDAPVHGGGDVAVMRDHQDGGAFAVQLAQQVQDRRPSRRVQVASGLVGHDQCRPPGQGSGDGGALLLATGELVGPVAPAVAEPDPLDRVRGQFSPPRDPASPVEKAVSDVVEHAEPVEQEELLEHEAQSAGPQPRQLFVGHGGGVLAGHPNDPSGGPFEGAHNLQEGALSRSDGPTMATSSPGSTRTLTPARATTGGSPGYSFTTSISSEGAASASLIDERGDAHLMTRAPRPVPALIPAPLIWTRVLLYSPVVTPTSRSTPPETTSTP